MATLDFATPKPGVLSFVLIGLMALLFIVAGKYIFNRWPVPGVSDIFNAA